MMPSYNADARTPLTQTNPDSLKNNLDQINSVLFDAENLLEALVEKVHGPTPQAADRTKEQEPASVAAKIMAINSHAQRIRDALQQFNQYVG